MTTIAVVKKGGEIAIAADTLTTFGSTRVPQHYKGEHAKILKFGDNHIGICGSSAHHLAVTSLLARETSLDLTSRQAVFETFRHLHPRLKEEYFLNPKEEDDAPYESSQLEALIANPHGIFSIFSYREAFEYDRFWAVGSGYRYALGAMFALYERLDSAAEIAHAGALAGCEFDTASDAPIVVHSFAVREANKKRKRK
jgi:ATP-dependent protease HslVU (ClpYQ) peptidase subunit